MVNGFYDADRSTLILGWQWTRQMFKLAGMSSNPLSIFVVASFIASVSGAAAEQPASSSPAATQTAPATSAAPTAAPQTPSLTPAEAYQEFLKQMVSPENLTDLVSKMDAVIDEADNADGSSTEAQNAAHAETRNGFLLEFSVIRAPEAIMYYAGISRKNEELLKYQEATMLFALFCDRIGLTHPIHITEGEKPVFHAQWLLKPTEWKVMRKKMLEVRAASREEKNLYTVMRSAVRQEANARVMANQNKKQPK